MRKFIKSTVLPIVISVAIGILLTEITLQLFFRIDDPYEKYKTGKKLTFRFIDSQFQPDQKFVFYTEEELSDMPDSGRYSTNNYGYRGDEIIEPKPDNEYRIFMVGGSTTECLFLDDTLAVTYHLQNKLNDLIPSGKEIKVFGAGKSGDKTYDHIAMISHRILFLEPDMIIIFPGINDLAAAIYNKDYTHPQVYDIVPEINFMNMIRYALTEFQIGRRMYTVLQPLFYDQSEETIQMAIAYKSDYKTLVDMKKKHPVSDKKPRTDLESYRLNLETIIGMAQIHAVDLMFMTQATSWNSQIDSNCYDWNWITYKNKVHYKEEYMDAALETYNDVLKNLGREYSIPVYDLAADIPKSLEYFYDDCHFNVNGSDFASTRFADFIANNPLSALAKPANDR